MPPLQQPTPTQGGAPAAKAPTPSLPVRTSSAPPAEHTKDAAPIFNNYKMNPAPTTYRPQAAMGQPNPSQSYPQQQYSAQMSPQGPGQPRHSPQGGQQQPPPGNYHPNMPPQQQQQQQYYGGHGHHGGGRGGNFSQGGGRHGGRGQHHPQPGRGNGPNPQYGGRGNGGGNGNPHHAGLLHNTAPEGQHPPPFPPQYHGQGQRHPGPHPSKYPLANPNAAPFMPSPQPRNGQGGYYQYYSTPTVSADSSTTLTATSSPAPVITAAPVVKRKVMEIIDPKTGLAISFSKKAPVVVTATATPSLVAPTLALSGSPGPGVSDPFVTPASLPASPALTTPLKSSLRISKEFTPKSFTPSTPMMPVVAASAPVSTKPPTSVQFGNVTPPRSPAAATLNASSSQTPTAGLSYSAMASLTLSSPKAATKAIPSPMTLVPTLSSSTAKVVAPLVKTSASPGQVVATSAPSVFATSTSGKPAPLSYSKVTTTPAKVPIVVTSVKAIPSTTSATTSASASAANILVPTVVKAPMSTPVKATPTLAAAAAVFSPAKDKELKDVKDASSEEEDSWENAAPAVAPLAAAAPSPSSKSSSTWSDKILYTLKELRSFKEACRDLPAAAKSSSSGWVSMELESPSSKDASTRPRGTSRGARGGSGAGPEWERSHAPNNSRHGGRGGGRGDGGGGEWNRGQDLPRKQQGGRGGGQYGNRSNPVDDIHMMPDGSGPVVALTISKNRWKPEKSTTNLTKAIMGVQSIMNKLTREKFERLATQLSTIQMDSIEVVEQVIRLIFDKALGEPHFCDMYADLCVLLSQTWLKWSFIKTVCGDGGHFFWTTIGEPDATLAGPFTSMEALVADFDAVSSGTSTVSPVSAPENLVFADLQVRDKDVVNCWKVEGNEALLYWSAEESVSANLNGPFETEAEAMKDATKKSAFKRKLLAHCQEEFEQDNVLEEVEAKITAAKAEGQTVDDLVELEEERIKLKRRMLGNIRFIGELYKKGMLRETIMHECIFKLMDCLGLIYETDSAVPRSLAYKSSEEVPEEDNLESLAKLLSTVGKNLEVSSSLKLDIYCRHMLKLSTDSRIGVRIRFMLKDVLELRQHKWVPRRKELKTKTLDEIRKDAANEEAKAARGSTQNNNNNNRNQPMDRRGSHSGSHFDNKNNHSRGSNSQDARFGNSNRGGSGNMSRDHSFKDSKHNGGGGGGGYKPHQATGQLKQSANMPPPQKGSLRASIMEKQKPRSSSGASSHHSKPSNTSTAKEGRPVAKSTSASTSSPTKKELLPSKDCLQAFKNIVKEYLRTPDFEEVTTAMGEKAADKAFASLDRPLLLCQETLVRLMTSKNTMEQETLITLVMTGMDQALFTAETVTASVTHLMKLGPDLKCDAPRFVIYFTDLLRALATRGTPLLLDARWMLAMGHRSADTASHLIWDEFVDCGLAMDVMGTLARHDRASVLAVWPSSTCLLSLFPSYDQTMKKVHAWVSTYHVDTPLATSLDPAFTLVSKVVDGESCESLVSWLQVSAPASTASVFFVQHLFCFLYAEVVKGSSTATTLLLGYCSDVEKQTALLHACEFLGADDTNALTVVLNVLQTEKLLPKAAWLRWKSDSTRPSNESSKIMLAALAALG